MTTDLILPEQPDLIGLTLAWLDEKENLSGSKRTAGAYMATLSSYMGTLVDHQLTWNDAGKVGALAALIQGWAGISKKGKGSVTAATYNHRVSIISSFYEYVNRRGLLGFNPASQVARRRATATNYAEPLQPAEIRARLAVIDRSNLIGKRDFAVLIVGLSTGRRVSELAGLAWGDVRFSGETATLHFRRVKGGKEQHDQLPARVAAALLDYYTDACEALTDAEKPITDATPLWLGFSPSNHLARAGRRAIVGICEKWLHTSQTHTLRHSFALLMKEAGATVFEIQHSLGHAHAVTTERYLQSRVSRPANRHGETIADLLDL